MSSIRQRILLPVIGLLLLGAAALASLSSRDASHEIEELFDAQLGQSARVLHGLLQLPQARLSAEELATALVESAEHQPALGHRYESKLAFQVRNADGQVIARSFNAPRLSADDWRPGFLSLDQQGAGWRRYVLSDAHTGMAVWVGEREDVRGELVSKIVRSTLLPDLIILPLLLLLVWLAIRSGLRPLERMAELIRRRQPDSLAALPVEPLPDELEPMRAALNRLLEQTGALLQREQRFIADAAHELRTPLAVLSIHAENARHSQDPALREQALQHLQEGVTRATRLVTQLLTLARLGDGQTLPKTPVALLQHCRDSLAQLLPLALQKQQELELEAADELPPSLPLEPGSLDTLVQNLVGNAIRHCPTHSRILLQIRYANGQLQLQVDDSGTGIPATQHEDMLQRFRSQGSGAGAGLGLSIARRICERHAGTLQMLDSRLGGLCVRATLMAADHPR